LSNFALILFIVCYTTDITSPARTAHSFRSIEVHSCFYRGTYGSICCLLCSALSNIYFLFLFISPLYCLSIYLLFLTTPLVSSNFLL